MVGDGGIGYGSQNGLRYRQQRRKEMYFGMKWYWWIPSAMLSRLRRHHEVIGLEVVQEGCLVETSPQHLGVEGEWM
jgi:hypothetical protein